MTKRKAITTRMKIDCLLWLVQEYMMKQTGSYPIDCPECGNPIYPTADIQWDHRHAIVFDGPHIYENLRPIHTSCHKKKTARDIKAHAKVKRIIKKRLTKRISRLQSRGFRKDLRRRMDGTIEKRR